ncbi:MAG: AAA domain-containing protein [Candidatus Cyclobacteriaceae bacterium M2_1C_046]
MENILKTYIRRLTNLTGNNRSLLLLRLYKDQFIDIHKFNRLKKLPSFAVIEALIAKKQFLLCDELDARDEETNQVSQQLKRLKRRESFIYEENGTRDLYVGWPFVKGQFADGTTVRCPLLFFPVKISLVKGKWILFPDDSVEISFNKNFLLAYSHFNEVSLDENFLEKTFEDYDKDSTVFRTALYQDLKESNLEINFNQENFTDELKPFEELTKKDLLDKTTPGTLKLHPEAVLGIFPQGGSNLIPDLQQMIDQQSFESLEELFAQRHTQEQDPSLNFIDKVREEKTFTPYELDAFQENALKGTKKGYSLVVQGPPGTGKSQLICNLVSDAIANNKKVLVVCQKKVALDVVFNRLQEKELHDFAALIHDHKNDRKEIFRKIAQQIDKIEEYQLQNRGLDTIQLERNFLKNSRNIDSLTEDLEEFRKNLFNESECGLSVKELYLTSSLDQPNINLKVEYRNFNFDTVSDFLKRLNIYTKYHQQFGKGDFTLSRRKSYAHHQVSDLQNMLTYVDDIVKFSKEFNQRIQQAIGNKLTLEESLSLIRKRHFVVEMLGILERPEAYSWFQHMLPFPDSATDNLWLSNMERVIMDCYKNQEPEVTLSTAELGPFQEILQKKLDSRRNLFKFISWSMFNQKEKKRINAILKRNKLSTDNVAIDALVLKMDNRLNLEHNFTKLRSKTWIKELPQDYSKVKIQNWFHLLRQTVKAKITFINIRNFRDFFNAGNISYSELNNQISALFKVLDELSAKIKQWEKYFSDSEIENLFDNPEQAIVFKKVLNKNFDAISEYDRLHGSFMSFEKEVIKKLEENQHLNPEEAEAVFINSLKLAWIEHIEIKYPVLRAVSSMKLKEMEADLQETVREKMEISKDILLLKARERTYENVEYNRLNNRTTYRDLHHQVTKKRRLWPLRKLITEFHEELFELLPCWMSSPEAVSALFPLEQIFDLVIFDEASQCFVEKGIPAIYRGRQVVIVGDHQQLQPNDLYQIRWNEETMDEPELEIESLLELSNRYLPSVQLKGHYRSESLALIDFSNRHFYDQQLRLLPQMNKINDPEPAISYHHVNGIWEKNTNKSEAEAVVATVMKLLDKNEHSIGIVTFNVQQQNLIIDLLESAAAERNLIIPSTIFVKNIENVQGDEKDIIIFSVGYAPDPSGRMVMQFGSLNQVNGENRLNVAVTRARRKVIIISSILPHELKVEDTKNEGPKLLKAYLQYALEVSKGEFIPNPFPAGGHSSSWYLKDKISSWSKDHLQDYEMINELPFAELTVKKENIYSGLLLTDDNLYYQSLSVKDFHVYTPFILNHKNWPHYTIFSREYWLNKEDVERNIQQFLNHHVEV